MAIITTIIIIVILAVAAPVAIAVAIVTVTRTRSALEASTTALIVAKPVATIAARAANAPRHALLPLTRATEPRVI